MYMEGAGIFDKFARYVGNITSNKLSPATDRAVSEYGDFYITQISVRRNPVEKVLQKVLNFISRGEYEKAKQEKYDDIYHLYLYVELADDKGHLQHFRTEKTPNIVWIDKKPNQSENPMDHIMNLQIPAKPKFKDVIQLTKQRMGVNFSRYTASEWNCQNYIYNLVESMCQLSHINFPVSLQQFILQDTENILTGTAKSVANGVTSLGHTFNRFLGGSEEI